MQLLLPGFSDVPDELDREFLDNASNAVKIGAAMSENLVVFESWFSRNFCDSYRKIAECWFLLAELYVEASVEASVEADMERGR